MRLLLRQIFRSGKFLVGFGIFIVILLTVLIYPLFIKNPPLETISRGTFLPPGVYVNVYDSMEYSPRYTLIIDEATARRINSRLGEEERRRMEEEIQ